MTVRKLIALAAIAAVLYFGIGSLGPIGIDGSARDAGSRAIARAFQDHASNVHVSGHGTVVRILEDDTDGSRHQRFILRLETGQKLLVAHNIDLAPRSIPWWKATVSNSTGFMSGACRVAWSTGRIVMPRQCMKPGG
jgi:hypothetical protein